MVNKHPKALFNEIKAWFFITTTYRELTVKLFFITTSINNIIITLNGYIYKIRK